MEHDVPIGVRLAKAFTEAYDELNLEGTAEALDGLRVVLCLEASVDGLGEDKIKQLREHIDKFEIAHNIEVHRKSVQYIDLIRQALIKNEVGAAELFSEELERVKQLLRGKDRDEFGIK